MPEVVMVVVAVVIALGKATIAVAVVMTAVAIKGLGASATVVALRSSLIGIAARVSRAAIGAAVGADTTMVGERARAAWAAA